MNQPMIRLRQNWTRLGPASISETKGIALAAVLLLLLIITLIGTVSLRMSREQQTMSLNLKQLTRAQFAAEQAVREAIDLELWAYDPDPNSTTWRIGGEGSGTDYSYVYTIEHKTARGAVVFNDDGFPYYVIRSEGVSGNGRRQLEVAVVRLYDSYNIVEDAFIGCEGIPFNANGDLKSYNSDPTALEEGDQARAKTLVADSDITIDSSTIIAGEVKATGDITVAGNAILLKSAYSNGDILVQNQARIEESAFAADAVTIQNSGYVKDPRPGLGDSVVPEQTCDPLKIDTFISTKVAEAGIDTTGSSNFDGTDAGGNPVPVSPDFNPAVDMRIPSGNYYFNSFELSNPVNQVTLGAGPHVWYVDGPLTLNSGTGILFEYGASLTLYITGKLSTDSNSYFGAPTEADLHTTVEKPINLQIFSSAVNATDNTPPDSNAMVNLQSNTSFMGVIYAPLAVVIFNSNTDSYGAVRGRWSHLDSNGDFWYDESLADEVTFDFTEDLGYKIVYWTEQSYDSYNTLNTSTVATSSTSAPATTTTVAPPSTTTGPVDTTTVVQDTTTQPGDTTTSVDTTSTTTTVAATTTTTTTAGPSFEIDNPSCGGSGFSFDLKNISGRDCKLVQIDVTQWPNSNSDNGPLEEVKIDNSTVATGSESAPTVFISASGDMSWDDPESPLFDFIDQEVKLINFGFKKSAAAGFYRMTLRFNPGDCKRLDVSRQCF